MGRVSIMSCLVTAGLVGYGGIGLSGLATGVSVEASETEVSINLAAETIAASEVVASRFPTAASQDAAPPEAAMLRAAAFRSDGIVTPSARMLRSAALRYGVLESVLRPSELAPYGSADAAFLSAQNMDNTAWWHDAFIARMLTADQAADFSIRPVTPAPATSDRPSGPAPAATTPAPVRLADASSQPAPTPRPVPAPHHHARPSAVLNDAQIASIKTRLNLTPDQEQMWPAVEAALHNISYTKTASAAQGRTDARMAYVDPDGPEVQQLKYAALPLVMRMSDDQKREVKSLAHVMGLDGLLSGFASWF